jgi:probable addiction module antidote protein
VPVKVKYLQMVPKKSGLNRENLYRILSEKGNPQLGSLSVILESMGLKLAVEVKNSKAA